MLSLSKHGAGFFSSLLVSCARSSLYIFRASLFAIPPLKKGDTGGFARARHGVSRANPPCPPFSKGGQNVGYFSELLTQDTRVPLMLSSSKHRVGAFSNLLNGFGPSCLLPESVI